MNKLLTSIFISLALLGPYVLPTLALAMTPGQELLKAAREGNLPKVKSLLVAHSDIINTKESLGLTSLHKAAQWGHTAIARLLLENHANANALDNDESTPLHLAVFWDQIEIIELLLENQANVNVSNRIGYTPLHYAAAYIKSRAIIELLLKYQANINASDKVNSATPLHSAVQEKHTEGIRCLLENKTDINVQDEEGNTPLHDTIRDSTIDKPEKTIIVVLLLAYGADTYIKNKADQSPLDIAIASNYEDIVELIQQAREFEKYLIQRAACSANLAKSFESLFADGREPLFDAEFIAY